MRVIKITTTCNYSACEETHYIRVPENADEEDLNQMLQDYIQNDIQPDGSWEDSSQEEAEEEGYEIEGAEEE